MLETALPNLAQSSTRLAADNLRAMRFIDSLAGRMDRILHAVQEQNWREAQRLSQWLAQSSAAMGYSHVAEKAELLATAVATPSKSSGIRQSLMSLIGACRGTKSIASPSQS